MEIGESGLDLQSYLEEAPTAWELVCIVCMCVFVWIFMTPSDAYVCRCVWLYVCSSQNRLGWCAHPFKNPPPTPRHHHHHHTPTKKTQLVKKTFVKKEEVLPLQMAEARELHCVCAIHTYLYFIYTYFTTCTFLFFILFIHLRVYATPSLHPPTHPQSPPFFFFRKPTPRSPPPTHTIPPPFSFKKLPPPTHSSSYASPTPPPHPTHNTTPGGAPQAGAGRVRAARGPLPRRLQARGALPPTTTTVIPGVYIY